MADVHRLEHTEFVKGIETKEYWSSTLNEDECFVTPDYDWKRTDKYFNEHWQSGSVKRAIVYGNVFGLAFGFRSSDHDVFFSDYNDSIMIIVSLLFGVREEILKESYWNHTCIYWRSSRAIPLRYKHFSVCDSKQDLLRAVMECFRGDLPLYLYTTVIEEAACSDLFHYVPYLKNLRYLELYNRKFGPKVQELVIQIIREAVSLEVLVLNHDPPADDEPPVALQSLDGVILELTKTSFASSMHMLVAFSCFSEPDVDMERGFFTISCDVLKKFIDTFLCAPSDHNQLLHLEGTTLACSNRQELCAFLQGVDCPSKKMIEFHKCKFSIVDVDF